MIRCPIREGDIVFVRGKAFKSKLIALWSGVSHVCIIYERDGDMYACEMSENRRSNVFRKVDDRWLRKWRFLHVLRVPGGVYDKHLFNDMIERKWKYGFRYNSEEYTYCTRHVIEILTNTTALTLPVCLHPGVLYHRITKYANSVMCVGDPYDYHFLCLVLVVCAVVVVAVDRAKRACVADTLDAAHSIRL